VTSTNPKYAPITADHNWFVDEKKILRIGPIDTDEDITTWTYKWQFRINEPDTDALITKLNAVITADDNTKCVDIPIDDTDTVDLGAVNGVHALMRIDSGNEGIISFGPAVLRQSAVRKE